MSLFRRLAFARIRLPADPPTDPFPVQSSAPWRPVDELPDVGVLIEVTGPPFRSQFIRARYQQGFRGTHWLLALTYEDNSTAVRWVDLRHLDGWRYL